MEHLTKSRRCCFCGEALKCDCFYHDYVLCKCDNSGKTYLDFDACPECLRKVENTIGNMIRYPN